MSLSDDPTSPTEKNRDRTGQEQRESPQDSSFLRSTETKMCPSDDPTSPTEKNRDRTGQEPRESPQDSFFRSTEMKMSPSDYPTSPTEKNRARTGQEPGECPQHFSFLSSKESPETSRSFISPMNRDEEALKTGQHGSENQNYFERSLDSAGNMGSRTYSSGYANNGISEQMMFTSGYANNGQSYLGVEPSNNSVGLRIGKPQQMSKSSGQGYGTNNLDSFGDQSNFLCVAGSLNSAGSQNDPTLMNVEGKQINITELPDDILVKILSHLPIKEVVATSVLSKQWRFVWKLALKLELSLGWL